MGDIFGGGNADNQNYELRGTVDSVDASSRSVYLRDVSGYNRSMLSGGSGDSVRVYYDDRTPVSYQGKSYRPEDLERGDVVSVRVDENGNSLVAESMTVITDVSGGNSSSSTFPTYGSNIRGTVRYIDTSRRTIEVDRGNGSVMTVDYDVNTPVSFNNQSYRVADLERGDEIELQVRDLGSGRYVAQQIFVTRSVSSGSGVYGSGTTSTQSATVRGTVRYVDTSRRTIELESASWRSNFNSSTGSMNNSSRITVSYDANTNVDVSGRMYPVSGLEVGDVVEVQVSNANASMPFANRILLVRDVKNRY
jgi:predicted RNA-binding protein with TRAM domain